MYYTHLVLPEELDEFDHNSLAKYDYYIFVIVSSAEEYRLALAEIGPLLASCDALCFLIDQERLDKLSKSGVVSSLFLSASSQNPKNAVSYIAAISKRALNSRAAPVGQWFELFLLLEDGERSKVEKIRSGITKALSEKPKDFAEYGLRAAKVLGWLTALLLRSPS